MRSGPHYLIVFRRFDPTLLLDHGRGLMTLLTSTLGGQDRIFPNGFQILNPRSDEGAQGFDPLS